MDREIWQPVPYETFGKFYEVSSHGRIKKKERRVVQNNRYSTKSLYIKKERIKKLSVHPSGHLYCTLLVHIKKKPATRTLYPHKACAKVFVPKPSKDSRYVCFKDGDFFNVHYTNLVWRTHSDIIKKGYIKRPEMRDLLYLRQVEAGRCLTREQHYEIRERLMRNENMWDIAGIYGVHVAAIRYHLNKMLNNEPVEK